MKKGLVLGKFLPLHKGHLSLIHFALQNCDFLYIIVCFTTNEPIEGIIRKAWLHEELDNYYNNISFISFPYDETVLPNTSESSREVSAIWAMELKKVVPDADIIFTSEPYGNFVARYMDIKHLMFNEKRTIVPVSATMINNHPIKYWDYLANSAKPYYVKKIVLLGSESTGKSTLAERLAKYYNTTFVPEMAREIIEKTDECTFENLEMIAVSHSKQIGYSISTANKILIIDTDINITKSYSQFLFGRELISADWIEHVNKADLYLFLEPDCPFIQDGTRLNEQERNRLSLHHKEYLNRENIPFVSIEGNWNNRYLSAIEIINKRYFA